jgi:Rps23 Pro-64 3,4-dihydroxylase Tpa1-like proline 4-hydroxylase
VSAAQASNLAGDGAKSVLNTTEVVKLTPKIEGDTVFFDRSACVKLGQEYHDQYVTNTPYPHISIDNFLPSDALRRIVAEFPQREAGRFANAHSNLKTGYKLEQIKSPYITNFLAALNSAQFLAFLENLTGIEALITDPHFAGAGLHETARGGHLSIHADFNMHPTLHVRRRMNLIIFLNEGWQASYGGALELWDKEMSACQKAIEPVLGRAVVFNTEADALHGHPDPLQCPPDVFRRSLALYYYTAATAEHLAEKVRTTQFKVRPNSGDKYPIREMIGESARGLKRALFSRWSGGKQSK